MKLKQGSSTDSSNTIKVTNSSGLPLNVLSSFNNSDWETNSLYENALIFLPMTNDDFFVRSGVTIDVKLLKNPYLDRGEEKPCSIYSLLFVNTNNLAPVDSSIVSKQEDLYPPVTVTKQAKDRMDLARSFYQDILVCPTSSLASNFIEALGKIAIPSADAVAENTVDAYFQHGRELYNTLSFSSVMAEMSYVNSSVGSWGENKEKFTFYLYAPEEASSFTEVKAPKFIGSLEFSRVMFSMEDPVDLEKWYSIAFKNMQGIRSSVKFTKGFLKADSLILCLTHYVTKKSYLTGKEGDDEFTSLLLGQIDDVRVIGVAVEQDLSSGSNVNAQWHVLWRPRSFAQFLALSMEVAGLLSSVYLTAKMAWRNINRDQLVGKNPLKSLSRIQEELKSLERSLRGTYRLLVGRDSTLPPSVSEISANFSEIFSKVRDASVDYFNRVLFVIQLEAIHKARLALEGTAKIVGIGPKLLEILWEMVEQEKDLLKLLQSDTLITSTQSDFLDTGSKLIEEASAKVKSDISGVLSKMSKANRDQIEEAVKDLEKLKMYLKIVDRVKKEKN